MARVYLAQRSLRKPAVVLSIGSYFLFLVNLPCFRPPTLWIGALGPYRESLQRRTCGAVGAAGEELEDVEPYRDLAEAETDVNAILNQIEVLETEAEKSSEASAQLARAEVVEAIHRALGEGAPRLDSRHMLRFAKLSGFDGSEQDWNDEFSALCQELGFSASSGLSVADLLRLVNDKSTADGYYSDDELQRLQKELLT
eukprot:TRINITY_DN97415_c0_g1_i1.p1 TRINITY_DN97415_c0_g1~~TRINITY_DN97415_c0_g1_i1.p1  ORF type:complete len:213 (-),score=38.16 TRINITY_DN97415_c0_g1_i1:98-694(-)